MIDRPCTEEVHQSAREPGGGPFSGFKTPSESRNTRKCQSNPQVSATPRPRRLSHHTGSSGPRRRPAGESAEAALLTV